jgi:hypothetical protein
MKELHEIIYNSWIYGKMTLEQIAVEEGLTVDEVAEVIAFMALIGY